MPEGLRKLGTTGSLRERWSLDVPSVVWLEDFETRDIKSPSYVVFI